MSSCDSKKMALWGRLMQTRTSKIAVAFLLLFCLLGVCFSLASHKRAPENFEEEGRLGERLNLLTLFADLRNLSSQVDGLKNALSRQRPPFDSPPLLSVPTRNNFIEKLSLWYMQTRKDPISSWPQLNVVFWSDFGRKGGAITLRAIQICQSLQEDFQVSASYLEKGASLDSVPDVLVDVRSARNKGPKGDACTVEVFDIIDALWLIRGVNLGRTLDLFDAVITANDVMKHDLEPNVTHGRYASLVTIPHHHSNFLNRTADISRPFERIGSWSSAHPWKDEWLARMGQFVNKTGLRFLYNTELSKDTANWSDEFAKLFASVDVVIVMGAWELGHTGEWRSYQRALNPMASGVPVILQRTLSHTEMVAVSGEGFSLWADSIDDVINLTSRLMKDDAFRRLAAKQSLAIASHFPLKKMAGLYVPLFLQLMFERYLKRGCFIEFFEGVGEAA